MSTQISSKTSATHAAVATVALRAPLALIQVPTVTPVANQVRVRVEWTASTPLDLHQADGGVAVTHPQVLGDGTAGTVVEIGPEVRNLKVGDKVFGFTWRKREEKAHQEYVTTEEYLFGKLPAGFTLPQAVTLPNNFVTVFHAVTTDLSISLPWPKAESYVPENHDQPLLIWGGSSSVGQFALQVLSWYGYTNLLATASAKHHTRLRSLGAAQVFDYSSSNVVTQIRDAISEEGARTLKVLDCIGSKTGSLAPIAQIARKGATIAVLLPVIVRDSSEEEAPEYDWDVQAAAAWQEGVVARGVRTHFYLENEFFKHHLQPEIMPTLLKDGVVTPQAQKIVEGSTLLERAQKALDSLRRKEVSMERLVWRVSEGEGI